MYEVICAKSEKYCSSRGSSLANGISKTPAEFFWDDRNLDQSESGNITERRPDVHVLWSSPFSLWEKGRDEGVAERKKSPHPAARHALTPTLPNGRGRLSTCKF